MRSHRSLIVLTGILAAAGLVACTSPAVTTVATAPPGAAATTAATAAPAGASSPPAAGSPTAAAKASPTGAAAAPSAAEVEPLMKLGWSFLYNTMDPGTSIGFNVRRNEIFEPLTRLEADGSYVGLLAESWRSVDPTTWEFKLRPQSIFHNNARATSEDVKFSFDRILDPANPGLGVVAQLGTIAAVQAVDPTTVRITTKGPDPLLVGRSTFVSVLPKAAFEAGGADYASRARAFAERPIGSGPYKYKSYTTNQQLTVEAFAEHPYRKAFTREIQTNFLSDTAARMAALQGRQIDMANSVPVDSIAALEAQGFKMNNIPFNNVQGVFLDSVDWEGKPVPELTDKRVRQALRTAVDVEGINRGLYGGRAQTLTQVLPKEVNGYNPAVTGYRFDPAAARQLLAAGGFPNGFTLDFEMRTVTSDFADMATIIQRAWQDIGVRTNLSFITDSTVSLDKFNGRSRRAPLFGFALTGQFDDGDTQLGFFRGDNRIGLRHIVSPEFDAAFIPAQTEVDPARRKQLLQRASQILNDEAAYLPVVTTVLIYGTDAKVTTRQGSDAYPQMEFLFKRR